jgi:hypothetical protein
MSISFLIIGMSICLLSRGLETDAEIFPSNDIKALWVSFSTPSNV